MFTTSGTVFVLSLINSVYQRIDNPVFAGAFTLLISDPLSDEPAASFGRVLLFEQLARNTTRNDIPTLIDLLRSPLLLQPVAQQLNTSPGALASRIKITQGRAGSFRSARNPQSERHRAQPVGNGPSTLKCAQCQISAGRPGTASETPERRPQFPQPTGPRTRSTQQRSTRRTRPIPHPQQPYWSRLEEGAALKLKTAESR